MERFDYVIRDENGLHARPAGLLVRQAQGFSSDLKIVKGEKSADLKRLFAVMGLAVKCGDEITLTAEGADEAEAARALGAFLREHF